MQDSRTLKQWLSLFFLLIPSLLLAQVSDQEAMRKALEYKQKGMSNQAIAIELSKQGVSMEQLQRIQQLSAQSGGVSGVQKETTQNINRLRNEYEGEDQPIKDIIENKTPMSERIYGQDLFSKENLTFSPNMNMPTPDNYVLGPGDEVLVDIWGDSEFNERYIISPDGFIHVAGLGRIFLSGLNVLQAEARLRSDFSLIYSDINGNAPSTFLGISIGNVKSIKVNVMGEVKTPGTYTLSSFSSAFHALYVAGGLTDIGSLRNIRIFRGGRPIATIDLYEYLMKGSNMQDITLKDGDIVKVEAYGILVQIMGEVKRPMKYEMRQNETIADLIRYAGNFGGKAFRGNITLYRNNNVEQEIHTVNENKYNSFRLKDGDRISVGEVREDFSNMIEITGAVYRPGQYALGGQITTVSQLVMAALGLKGEAYSERALLYRTGEDKTQHMISVNIDALLKGEIPDIALQKEDVLHIPSISSLEDDLTISITGEVRKPGVYSFAENMRLEDALLRANGLRESASRARIEVYRRVKKPDAPTASKEVGEKFTFTLENEKIISNDPNFVLQPFDMIVIRRSPAYEEQQIVRIEGEVQFTGEYARIQRDERISSFIERAGGLTEFAYIRGAKLLREMTKEEKERTYAALVAKATAEKDSSIIANLDYKAQPVGIDLEAALRNPGSDKDLILKAGDVLTIPQYIATVKISGAVMYPNTVIYDQNKTLRQYIKQAGGFSRLAMKRKPYVIYLNGQVATGSTAKIEPGCEIVVPERPEREPVSIQNILGISTSLASLALIISRFF